MPVFPPRCRLSACPLIPTRITLSSLNLYYGSLNRCRLVATLGEDCETSSVRLQLLLRRIDFVMVLQLYCQAHPLVFMGAKVVKPSHYDCIPLFDDQQASQP